MTAFAAEPFESPTTMNDSLIFIDCSPGAQSRTSISSATKRRMSHQCLPPPPQKRLKENLPILQSVEARFKSDKGNSDVPFPGKQAVLATSTASQSIDSYHTTGVLYPSGLQSAYIYPNKISPSPTPSLAFDLPSSDGLDCDSPILDDSSLFSFDDVYIGDNQGQPPDETSSLLPKLYTGCEKAGRTQLAAYKGISGGLKHENMNELRTGPILSLDCQALDCSAMAFLHSHSDRSVSGSDWNSAISSFYDVEASDSLGDYYTHAASSTASVQRAASFLLDPSTAFNVSPAQHDHDLSKLPHPFYAANKGVDVDRAACSDDLYRSLTKNAQHGANASNIASVRHEAVSQGVSAAVPRLSTAAVSSGLGSPPVFWPRRRLDLAVPQDIPPPIRPPGSVPSRPSSPEPARPRPMRPSANAPQRECNLTGNNVTGQISELVQCQHDPPSLLQDLASLAVGSTESKGRASSEPFAPSRSSLNEPSYSTSVSYSSSLVSSVEAHCQAFSVQSNLVAGLSSKVSLGIFPVISRPDLPEGRYFDRPQPRTHNTVSGPQSPLSEDVSAKPTDNGTSMQGVMHRLSVTLNPGKNAGPGDETSDEEPLAHLLARRTVAVNPDSVMSSGYVSLTADTTFRRRKKGPVVTHGNPMKSVAKKSPTISGDSAPAEFSLKDRCQTLWKGPPSLFPFPLPCRRTNLAREMEQKIRKAVSFKAVMDQLTQQHSAISKHDENQIGSVMLHPPRAHIYDIDTLIAFQGIRWDIDGFVAMELSALPWLAFVENDLLAQKQGLNLAEAPKLRKRKRRSCVIEQPTAQSCDWDVFLPLYSGMALPDWFVSGGVDRVVGMDDLEAVTTG